MYHFPSFHLGDMTACSAALRRLGIGAADLQDVAGRVVRHLFESFTRLGTGEPACVLVRLFKTIRYDRLAPELQRLAAQRMGGAPPDSSIACLTLLGSAGVIPGWNDLAQSGRFRVIPLSSPEEVDRLPMFSQLFHQMGWSLPSRTQPSADLLVDRQEHAFNVFHILQAAGSPYVPAQEEFVGPFSVRSVLGFGAVLPDNELFTVILFSRDTIPESVAQLFKPLALSVQVALAPHVDGTAAPDNHAGPSVRGAQPISSPCGADPKQARIDELERLLRVYEETARTQAEQIDMIVKGSGVGTWDWHIPSGRVVFNERWATMLGYELAEIEPHVRAWERLVHPDDKPAIMQAVAAHLRGETPMYCSEHRLRHKSGAWHWVYDSGQVLVRDAGGAPIRAAGIHLDITGRKQLEQAQARAQQEIRDQQQALDHAQALAHLGSWEWDIVTGAERWSDEQFRVFGYAPNQITPTYDLFLRALHPDDLPRVREAVDAALHRRVSYNIDCRIIRPSGEVRHVNCRGLVHRNVDGQPIRMTGTVLDMTDSKQAESALRASEAQIRSIFESAIEGIVVIDERGTIEQANPALAALLGYEDQELVGRNISVIMPSPHREDHDRYLADYLRSGERHIIGTGREVVAMRKDGLCIDIYLSVSEMRVGSARKYTGMLRDITGRKRVEANLRKSEERFRQLAEHIDAVFWLTSPDKQEVLYVSPAFETIWGCSRAALYARPTFWLEHVHPDDRERIATAAACQATFPYDEEYRIVTPSGAVRWIRDRSFPIKDEKGAVYRLAGIAVDITAAKTMAEKIRSNEAQYRALVELSPHAIFVNCGGRIVFANHACLQLLGAKSERDLLGKPIMGVIHADFHSRVTERIEAMESRWRPVPPLEERFVRLDGTVIDVEVAAAPVTHEGQPAIQVIATDISARKHLEQALVATNLQLTAILDGATHESIIATDPKGLITTFNSGAEYLLGYASSEMVGERLLTHFHLPEELEARSRQLSELYGRPIQGFDVLTRNAESGGFDEREWTYVRKDGARRTVLLTVTALRQENGTLTGFLAMGKDITRRKEAEAELALARDEALRTAQLKADFLATMSHEIRTPMNAIIGMTGLLLDTALTDEQRDFADTVRRSSDALLTLVNDILDFSKIEAGKLHFENIDFDLRLTVEDTLDLLADQAQGKGLELVGLVEAAVPMGVQGDPGRLRQILVNLVGNAIKFTSSGEVFVHVKRDDSGDPNLLRFSVTDTGIGIPTEVQSRLFQAFVQADSSTTRRFGGTGLGLAICQRLVAQMGGQIGIESQPGEGSTFWFTVRLPEAAIAPPASAGSWAALNGCRVLLVEQNGRAERTLRQQLTSRGMDCTCALNGNQAIDMAMTASVTQKPFDVALIELYLPGMDGFETARRLKNDPLTSGLRVVILTTVGRRGDGEKAQALGIDAYLTKPIRQAQLFDCLTLLLKGPSPVSQPGVVTPQPLITRHTLAESGGSGTPRLLLVEDNPVNQKVACKMLEKLGYRVDVAANGLEAVTAQERSPYPLIFMDCQMPEMDGFEATALIRKKEGRTAHTPIIAMTANALSGDRERCLAAGMDDYLAKPIRPTDLQAILDRWLVQTHSKTGTEG